MIVDGEASFSIFYVWKDGWVGGFVVARKMVWFGRIVVEE